MLARRWTRARAAAPPRLPVPVAAVVMDQAEGVRLLPGPDEDSPPVPAYAYPESAIRALGHAVRYGTWRATTPGRVPDLDGLAEDRARELVAGFRAGTADGGWLTLDSAADLLSCYGVRLANGIAVTTEHAVIAAAARIGGPATSPAANPAGDGLSSETGDAVPWVGACGSRTWRTPRPSRCHGKRNTRNGAIVYCRPGRRAALAVVTLKELGFENVANLDGGFATWKDAGPAHHRAPRGDVDRVRRVG